MSAGLTLRVTASIHQGMERDYQEDNFIIGADPAADKWTIERDSYSPGAWGTFLVVADGMGGLNAGEEASRLAVDGFRDYFRSRSNTTPPPPDQAQSLLTDAILSANEMILRFAHQNPQTQGMGTTIVVAWLYGNSMHVAWSGDSRCYLLSPGGQLRQVNSDHSYVQDLITKGEITEEEAFFHPNKNIITQSLGDVGRQPVPEYVSLTLAVGDRVLLCSDGLNSMLDNPQIASLLTGGEIPDAANRLVDAANAAGGYDNITVVLCEVMGVGSSGAVAQQQPTEQPIGVEAPNITPHLARRNSILFQVTRRNGRIIGALFAGLCFLGVFSWIIDTAFFSKKVPVPQEKTELEKVKEKTRRDSLRSDSITKADRNKKIQEAQSDNNSSTSPTHFHNGGRRDPVSPHEVPAPSVPTPEESKQMRFTTLLNKAIAAVSNTDVVYRVLSDIKKDGSNENTCKQLPSLRISNKDAVKDFIRHCEVEYCSSKQSPATAPIVKDTQQEKKNAKPLTKDQKTLMSKVAHKKFYVQVASFKGLEDANNEKDRLGKLGLRNLTIYPNFKSPLRKRVIIPYPSKAEAQKALPEIEKITQRKCTIFELEDQSK